MRRFYAQPDQFDGQIVKLAVDETRHLRDVLRMQPGEKAQIFDGDGREFLAEVESIGKRETLLKIVEEIDPPAPESNLDLTLAACVYKNDKYDLVIQKAVELGVASITPMVSFRSEVNLQATLKRTERWRKIALEATKQCERAKVMIIGEPLRFEDAISGVGPHSGLLLMFSEKNGKGVPEEPAAKKITALVGPKGGWEDSEIESARNAGFGIVTLGGRILRAETAAISIAAILQHRFGDLN